MSRNRARVPAWLWLWPTDSWKHRVERTAWVPAASWRSPAPGQPFYQSSPGAALEQPSPQSGLNPRLPARARLPRTAEGRPSVACRGHGAAARPGQTYANTPLRCVGPDSSPRSSPRTSPLALGPRCKPCLGSQPPDRMRHGNRIRDNHYRHLQPPPVSYIPAPPTDTIIVQSRAAPP